MLLGTGNSCTGCLGRLDGLVFPFRGRRRGNVGGFRRFRLLGLDEFTHQMRMGLFDLLFQHHTLGAGCALAFETFFRGKQPWCTGLAVLFLATPVDPFLGGLLFADPLAGAAPEFGIVAVVAALVTQFCGLQGSDDTRPHQETETGEEESRQDQFAERRTG